MGNKKGVVPWNKGKTRFTDAGVRKISETMRKKHIDNFAKWRNEAKNRGIIPNTKDKLIKSRELASLIGLILGDGNIDIHPRAETLRLTLGSDKPALITYTAYLIKEVFNKTPSIKKRNDSNCFNITLCQKNLSKRLGIPAGARGKLEIKLASWIWNNKQYLISALKGLYEAEASYCVHKKTYTYNFEFSNRNISLLNEVEKGLRILGFKPERRTNSVRLREKEEAVKLREIINFRTYPDI